MTQGLQAILLALIAMLALPDLAVAQPGTFETRGFVIVNGGYQLTANDFDVRSSFRANAEDGSFTTEYDLKGGPALDVAGGAMLWRRRLGVSVGVTRFSRSTPSSLSGSVPHPFYFSRPRSVRGDIGGLKREELGVHVQARAIVPIGSRLQVMAFGGPSFFQVKQGMVTHFTWVDSYPFDDASFSAASTTNAKGSKVGFNAGADVAFFFIRQVGVGGTVQFSGATVEVEGAGNTQDVKAGGAKAGVGLRVRF